MPIAWLAVAWLAIAPTAAWAESNTLADHSDCADVNQSGEVNSSDLIYLVNFVFKFFKGVQSTGVEIKGFM